jgi:hypothetical protein
MCDVETTTRTGTERTIVASHTLDMTSHVIAALERDGHDAELAASANATAGPDEATPCWVDIP